MGQIITKLMGNDIKEREFIDFENLKPPSSNEQIYANIKEILERSDEIIEKLSKKLELEESHQLNFRKVLAGEQSEVEFKLYFENILRVQKDIYDYSLLIEECCEQLIEVLCEYNGSTVLEKESLLVLFCSVIAFALKFDDLKMASHTPIPRGQNNYYKRTHQRLNLSNDISMETMNRMNLFLAYPTPMMNVINESLVKFILKKEVLIKGARSNTVSILSFITNNCIYALNDNKFQNENTIKDCMRVMTGSIILFDHLDEKGAFHKHSPIQIKKCISILKEFPLINDNNDKDAEKEMITDALMNALRFTTIHLNDPLTPARIKHLLD